MNLSLCGHEPGARRGAGQQQSTTSGRGPVGVVQVFKSLGVGGGGLGQMTQEEEETETKKDVRMLGTRKCIN